MLSVYNPASTGLYSCKIGIAKKTDNSICDFFYLVFKID